MSKMRRAKLIDKNGSIHRRQEIEKAVQITMYVVKNVGG